MDIERICGGVIGVDLDIGVLFECADPPFYHFGQLGGQFLKLDIVEILLFVFGHNLDFFGHIL